jgi:hypothetical protein
VKYEVVLLFRVSETTPCLSLYVLLVNSEIADWLAALKPGHYDSDFAALLVVCELIFPVPFRMQDCSC